MNKYFLLLLLFVSIPSISIASEEVFLEVLKNRPSNSESRIIGKRIDKMFSDIEQSQVSYGDELTRIEWGGVYDSDKLMTKESLKNLMKINLEGKEITEKAIRSKIEIITSTIQDLNKLSSKSSFAKAMLFEIEDKYHVSETGFKDTLSELAEISANKHVNIQKKLELLDSFHGNYRFSDKGEFEVSNTDMGKLKADKYTKLMLEHNSITARQRTLAHYFSENRRLVVSRFHELKGE